MVDPHKLAELRRNYDAFTRVLPTLLAEHEGEYALMRHGQVVAYFGTPGGALRSGRERYEDDLFSVQEVTTEKADFGWYSRAPSDRPL
jgi:hypothetical protein